MFKDKTLDELVDLWIDTKDEIAWAEARMFTDDGEQLYYYTDLWHALCGILEDIKQAVETGEYKHD